MPQAVTIRSLPMAFEFVKAMRADGLERARASETFRCRRILYCEPST
jgi:hypothetical protein